MNFSTWPEGQPKPKISEAEQARRRDAVTRADAHNRIEGVYRTAKSDKVFEAFIRGDIELQDLTPQLLRLKA